MRQESSAKTGLTLSVVGNGGAEFPLPTVKIGPEKAKEMLKTYNVDYRKYRETYADGLARDMQNGDWVFDGSPIRVDTDGNLFDGQHRLNAVIKSGTMQEFLVITGLPVSAYNTTDTGLARNYGDSLRRDGYTNVIQRSALIGHIGRWTSHTNMDATRRLTNAERQHVQDEHVDTISRAIQNGVGRGGQSVDMPLSLWCFVWWLLSSIDQNEAAHFLDQVSSGENIHRGMPAFALRTRLRNLSDEKVSRNRYLYMVFSAWNAFREGRELQTVGGPVLISHDRLMETLPQ